MVSISDLCFLVEQNISGWAFLDPNVGVGSRLKVHVGPIDIVYSDNVVVYIVRDDVVVHRTFSAGRLIMVKKILRHVRECRI